MWLMISEVQTLNNAVQALAVAERYAVAAVFPEEGRKQSRWIRTQPSKEHSHESCLSKAQF